MYGGVGEFVWGGLAEEVRGRGEGDVGGGAVREGGAAWEDHNTRAGEREEGEELHCGGILKGLIALRREKRLVSKREGNGTYKDVGSSVRKSWG